MRSLYKIFHPEVFQGSLRKKNYFEGWYFKHVSAGADDAFAVIPGVSLSEDAHAFIQYNDGKTGKSSYFRYSISDFYFDRKKLMISIGNSVFTEKGISLDLANESFSIRGDIAYSGILKPPSNIFMPGIMGWYSYVPWMECNHGVLSVTHGLSGTIEVNGESRSMTGGNGYIEKDWGVSFPEFWLWLQCNSFTTPGASVMISVAKIPWMGSFFIGFVAFFSLNGETTIFATYNGARILSLRLNEDNNTEVIITKGAFTLKTVISAGGHGILKAPSSGTMINNIKESIDSEISLEVTRSGKSIFSENGRKTGYEVTDGILRYFR